jgi:hypothetical protein
MNLKVEDLTTKKTYYKDYKEIPLTGDIINDYKIIYSGYGDIIDDGIKKYQEWIILKRKLNIFERILKKIKFYDYF